MRTVYSSLKVFGFPDHIEQPALARTRVPIHVRVKPINACNHRCWFCAYRADDLSLGGDMDLKDRIPLEKMDEIVDDFITMGVKAVTFSGGGEPLLYPHMASTIERLGRGGVAVATLTNGTYLKGEIADRLAQYGTWVRVSMDGWNDESYQQSRKTKPGEFERIAENIAAFAARKSDCSIGISFIVGQQNAEHIAEFCAFAKGLGVEHVKMSACVVGDGGATNNSYHEAIREVVQGQIRQAKALEDEGFSVIDYYHGFADRFDKPYGSCPMLEYLTVIGADCNVYACQDKAYTESGLLGSIKDQSFAEFWGSSENAARIGAINPRRDCGHHCASHQKNLLLTEYRNIEDSHLVFV